MSWFTNGTNSRRAVICLTEECTQAPYSSQTDCLFERIQLGRRMTRKTHDTDAPAFSFKNDSARQRWELFHRAIAHAKQTNLDDMEDRDPSTEDASRAAPRLSIVR